jgi:hypothetical protein
MREEINIHRLRDHRIWMNAFRVAGIPDAFQQWPESVREKTGEERIRATDDEGIHCTCPQCPSYTLPAKENGELFFVSPVKPALSLGGPGMFLRELPGCEDLG